MSDGRPGSPGGLHLDPRVRTALTLAVLGLLLVAGTAWGWSALTQPLPRPDLAVEEPPLCTDRTVEAGSTLGRGDVVVSVYNGGTTAGLAGRTLSRLAERGFVLGESGNAGERIPRVQVWAPDRRNPAVRLVRSHLGRGVRVVEREGLGPGITVVVGDDFGRLARGRRQVQVREDATVCSPPADTAETPAG
ncbi:LytR C-terminal domain-containing protein [Nocardioides perillae]|uniref:LytR/CpsA/Psr regulator C-terminal domain-containing protein n=1 Tax=Nocardioides perillae TaxID=1119534 RepID=A0A7Y9UKX0_9ACTN|nr:hypothetical protein [Nocardioides perillae]